MMTVTDTLHIKPSDLVLEIGSGNKPHPRSNILCDKFIHSNTQRSGGFTIVIDRPIVICDGEALPFRDKQFDYVIASHILEHMEHPQKFIDEIVRVGKSGYIEVPTAVSERLFGWSFHLWYVLFEKNTIVMYRKNDGEKFGGFFHRFVTQHISFRRWFEDHATDHYLKIEWSNNVKLRIVTHYPKQELFQDLDSKMFGQLKTYAPDFLRDYVFFVRWLSERGIRKLYKIFRLVIYRLTVRNNPHIFRDYLNSYIVCPSCHEQLKYIPNGYMCVRCKRRYRLENNIPELIVS